MVPWIKDKIGIKHDIITKCKHSEGTSKVPCGIGEPSGVVRQAHHQHTCEKQIENIITE